MVKRIKAIRFVLLIFLVLPIKNFAQQNNTKLKLFGDVRNRIENDWDSQKQDGSMRSDRLRMRLRFRFGFVYNFNNNIRFGGRIRTGNPLATQSPHTDYGNELIPKSLGLDKAYIKVKWQEGFFWVGKNSYPFWKQNEMFWDDDATPEGLAINHLLNIGGKNTLKLIGGYFLLDESKSNGLSDKAKFYGVQTVLDMKLSKTNIQTALGYLKFNEDTTQVDARLFDLNYQLIQVGAKVSFPFFKEKKLMIGGDISYNLEDYGSAFFNNNQKLGYVGSIKYGNLSTSGSWLIGYYFSHIEKYAVVPGYAQDDWVRWGSSTVTRSSNFEGNEFRIAYAFSKKHNIVARLYLVNGIVAEKKGSQLETAKRFRIDWNIGF